MSPLCAHGINKEKHDCGLCMAKLNTEGNLTAHQYAKFFFESLGMAVSGRDVYDQALTKMATYQVQADGNDTIVDITTCSYAPFESVRIKLSPRNIHLAMSVVKERLKL